MEVVPAENIVINDAIILWTQYIIIILLPPNVRRLVGLWIKVYKSCLLSISVAYCHLIKDNNIQGGTLKETKESQKMLYMRMPQSISMMDSRLKERIAPNYLP